MEFVIGNVRITLFKFELDRKWIVKKNLGHFDSMWTPVVPAPYYVRTLKRRVIRDVPNRANRILAIKRIRQIVREDLGDDYSIMLKDAKDLVDGWGYGER